MPDGSKFCKECGKKLELAYPGCRKTVPPDSNFCLKCGRDLRKALGAQPVDLQQPRSYTPKHLVDKILTNRSSIEGERKLVTVIFADVARFTSMSEKLDPDTVDEVLDGWFRILLDEVHKFEGTINQFRGDGIMALFGAPIAHEDHAQRACYDSLAVRHALVAYGEKPKQAYGVSFEMEQLERIRQDSWTNPRSVGRARRRRR